MKIKKALSSIMALVLILSFSACTANEVASNDTHSDWSDTENGYDVSKDLEKDFENMNSMEKISYNWNFVLLGNEDNLTNPVAKAKAVEIGNQGIEIWNTMNMGDSVGALWGDTNAELSESALSSFYGNLYTMTLAWGTPGSMFYHKENLKQAIIFGLDWMYDNLYGQNVITDGTYGNWWQWKIGGPRELVRSLIILRDELSEEQIEKYLSPVDHLMPTVSYTGANRVWIGYIVIASALLQNDEARLAQAVKDLDAVYEYVTVGDGFYTDGSFIQHNRQAYNGSYATAMISYVSELCYILRGSDYQVSEGNALRISEWVENSMEPLMVDGLMMSFTRGRELTRAMTEFERGVVVIEAMLKASLIVGEAEASEIRKTIKYYCVKNSDYDYTLDMPIYLSPILQQLIDDTNVSARKDYTVTHVFHGMDRLLQQKPEYTVGVTLSSTRIYKYEAINNENTEGWYLGDGMVYVYTGNRDQYDSAYWNHINHYRMPGTTVLTTDRIAENVSGGYLGAYNAVGGTTVGNVLAGGMHLGKLTTNTGIVLDLDAKKSYFMFDGEVVCLGAGITANSSDNVETVIENRKLSGTEKFYVDGTRVSLTSGVKSADGVKYAWLEDYGGLVFTETMDISYQKAVGGASFLEIWHDHGVNPVNDSYSYIILPNATMNDTAVYQASPDARILSNTADLQAVYDKSTQSTGMIFWQAGVCGDISVNAPCAAVVTEADGVYSISISDMSQKLSKISVTVSKAGLVLNSADDGVTVTDNGNGTYTLVFSVSGNNGADMRASFKIN